MIFTLSMRQGFGANAGLTSALFAGFVAGFCVGANAGLTARVRCWTGKAAFAAAPCTGSFAGGMMSALVSAAFSSSPGNCSSSLPAMAARMKSIQMGSAAGCAGLFFAQRFAAVVAHPHAASDGRREAQKPGVGKVAGGAGFAAEGMVQLRGRRAGAVLGDAAQQGHHGARRLLVDHLVDCGCLLPQSDAVGVRNFADEPRRARECRRWGRRRRRPPALRA